MNTAPVACPGPCNNAWRRAENNRTQYGTEHDLTATWGEPTHCTHCTDRTRQRLTELPRLVTAIHLEAVQGSRGGPKAGTIGRIAGGIPMWPGQPSRILTDLIIGGLTELEDDIRQLRGLSARPARNAESASLNNAVRFLTAHLDWALTHHPAAAEIHEHGSGNPASQINGWHRTALRFTKQDEQRDIHRLAPCPRCHGPYLIESRDMRLAADDQAYIECRDPDCRRVMTRSEYDTYVRDLHAAIAAAA